MEVQTIKCPHCQSSFDMPINRKEFYCIDCGAHITIKDGSNTEFTYNYNRNTDDKYTYRKIDEARIKEANVHEIIRLKELEIELEKAKNELKKAKSSEYSWIWGMIAMLVGTGFIVLIALLFA